MDLLWDKGFALCYKDRFNAAYFAGTNNLTINMRTDMPDSDNRREYRMNEDLSNHTGDLSCNCAVGNLNFLGSEWGPPPACYLNLKKILFKPEVFAELEAGLPKAAQDVANAPPGAHLSANLSYLLYLIRRGDGLLNEAAAQIRSFINQDRIRCVLGEQLAEDHLATLNMLLSDARAQLSAGMERAGFAAPGKRSVIHQQVGDHAIYMMSPPDGKEIIDLNRLQCKHSSKLVNCRVDHNQNLPEPTPSGSGIPKSALKTTKPKEAPAKKVALPATFAAQDIRFNPESAKNTKSVDTIFIGGETLAELKEELESSFQDISLTASVHRADQVEQMPEVLKGIARGRHPNDCSSIRVVLVPLRSSKESQTDIEKSLTESVLSCMSFLAKYCAKEHKTRLRADHKHSCEVELLTAPKVPALSVARQLMDKLSNKNTPDVKLLDDASNRTRAISAVLGRFKQFKRMTVHSSKHVCYTDPKDDNFLRNFKTSTGERGTMENLKDLVFTEGNLRRSFINFIVGIASTRWSELHTPKHYGFLLENGLSVVPPQEQQEERAKRPRSTSSHRSKSKPRKRHNRESDEEDLREKLDRERSRGRR